MEKVLLHICCAPCCCYPYSRLRREYEIVGFWYNPNIHPYSEYQKRLMTVGYFSQEMKLPIVYGDGGYILEDWLKGVASLALDDDTPDKQMLRCGLCYKLRLSKAANYAKEKGFDYFTTTLLYSKYQRHDLIKKTAEDIAQKYNIKFLYQDFRLGWEIGVKISKGMGLYRQNYCGCIFSEKERFLGKKKTNGFSG